MNIVISFSPWILFGILSSWQNIRVAALFSTAIVFLIIFKNIKNIKILDIGTLIYFSGLSLAVFVSQNPLIKIYAPVVGNAVLFVIALISMLIKKPFTIQYAKEKVPKELWDKPGFYSTNLIITEVWCATFALITVLSYFEFKYHSPVITVIHVMAFVGAIKFSSWYPELVRKSKKALE